MGGPFDSSPSPLVRCLDPAVIPTLGVQIERLTMQFIALNRLNRETYVQSSCHASATRAKRHLTRGKIDAPDTLPSEARLRPLEAGLVPFARARGEASSPKGGRHEVVLLDMTLPGMSGSHVFAELRRIRPDAKVIRTSA
jgi:hypothetical protein